MSAFALMLCVASLASCNSAFPSPRDIPEDLKRIDVMIDNIEKNSEFNPENQNTYAERQKRDDWQVKGDVTRDRFGNIGSEISLGKSGKDYDVNGVWRQNSHGSAGPVPIDRTYVGVQGQIRF